MKEEEEESSEEEEEELTPEEQGKHAHGAFIYDDDHCWKVLMVRVCVTLFDLRGRINSRAS